MLGFGAGCIAATSLGEIWRLCIVLIAMTAFETLLGGPLWPFLFRFESREANTLESSIEDEARAVTGVGANGNGDLSRTRQVDGDPAPHHRHDNLEQGDQLQPRHHRSDHRSRRERNAAAGQGTSTRERECDRAGDDSDGLVC